MALMDKDSFVRANMRHELAEMWERSTVNPEHTLSNTITLQVLETAIDALDAIDRVERFLLGIDAVLPGTAADIRAKLHG